MDFKKKKAVKSEESTPDINLPYLHIFKYATTVELLATLVGVLAGLLSGSGLCYNLVQFGELTTAFVERTTQQDRLSSYLPLTSLFGGGTRLANASHEENMEALVNDAIAMGIGMSTSIILSIALNVISVALINWSAMRQITRIRILFLKAVLSQDMAWYDTDTEFNLASRMSENMMKLKDGLGEKIAIVSNLVGTAVICLVTAFPMGWELSLACSSVVPFSIAASFILSNYQTKSSMKEMESYSQAGKQAEEVLKSIRTIVAFGGEKIEVDRYANLLEPAVNYGRKRGLYTGLGTAFSWILTYSLNAIGLMYGTRLVLADMDKESDERRYLVGIIFSVLFSVYMANQSFTLCVPHLETFALARGAATSIFSLLATKPNIDSPAAGDISPRPVIGEICIEEVHFSYPSRPKVKVLENFSLHVKPGECVALVGSSGCGKSTVLQLIQRLYDPHIGTVKLDGENIKNLNLGWLRSSIGVVGQEPVLFFGTIHDNIAIGRPEATREDVQRAADIAYAHNFIIKMRNGYDTLIGERGASLSGGQKQRIAIARALLRNPALLLLDEATSALDPHSEKEVQAALDRASVGRTTLTVSHRLSTIINADRIICMDHGSIVEQGTHKELMKLKGVYYKLVSTGSDNKEPDEIEALPEEEKIDDEYEEQTIIASVDVKRKSGRGIVKRNSTKRDNHEWPTPHGSISSVISTGLQNITCNNDYQSDEGEKKRVEENRSIGDWELIKLNSPEWLLLVLGSVAAFVQGACFPAFACLFGYTSGIFAFSDRVKILYLADLYSGMFCVVAAIAGLAMCLQSTNFTNAGLKMTSRLRQQYFSALLNQEMGYFDKESNTVGALCSRLSADTAEVQGATGLRIGIILQGISSVVIGFILAVSYNWKLALVGTTFIPLMVGSIWLEGIISQQSQADERAAMESATSVATEAVTSIRTVQSLGVENVFLNKFKSALVDANAALAKKTKWRGLVLGIGIYVPFLAYCSIAIYGASLVAYDGIDYKVVILVNEALMYGAYMLGQSLVYAPSLKSAKASACRILSLINREPEVKTLPGIEDKKDWVATGSFDIRGLEFSYPTRPRQNVLKCIDLKLEPGRSIALVGSSGCGKSTVLQLIQRLYDPVSGHIALDDRDTRTSISLPQLRRQLGVVQQEPVLFDRTIAENIAYGDNSREVSTDEIIEAAKAANIHSFIVSLPQGYDTNLGASGAQLSGGQKQRVCIARALIRSPRILLLDEATSALDANSEKAVSEALDKAAMGRTCITIAHRLSTIKDCNVICVLDKGNIVERGTHTELMNLKGYYWRMSKGQNMAVG